MKSSVNERYRRQLALKEVSTEGQLKLAEARVLIIGAGGLGCPALQYLAGAGIGTLGIADHDVVSLSNLHRQTIYKTSDVGQSKASLAGEFAKKLNPEINIRVIQERLTSHNAIELFSDYDIIMDGSDNFSTRYMVNDACVILKKTLVYGAVSRFEGQIAVFDHSEKAGMASSNYRDLFPDPPKEGEIQNCEEAGVLGVLPGIIGSMMAAEAIKVITGIGTVIRNRLLTYNLLTHQIYEIELSKSKSSNQVPDSEQQFRDTDYDTTCSTPSNLEVDVASFKSLLDDGILIVDVREIWEEPEIDLPNLKRLPISSFHQNLDSIGADKVVIVCQTGKRSLLAAEMLAEHRGSPDNIFSLKGGISEWRQQEE